VREGTKPLVGRPRRRREDNIEMDVRAIGSGCMDWIHLALYRDQWSGPVNTVMNLGLRKILGKSYLAVQLSASQNGLWYMQLEELYPTKPSLSFSCVSVEIVFGESHPLSPCPPSLYVIRSWFDDCRVHTPGLCTEESSASN
jgi:hypothetical protein